MPVTQRVPKPWEMCHRYGDYAKALSLSMQTNSPTDIHLLFTPATQKIIHIALQDFNSLDTAAGLAMIEPKVLKTWLRLGELGFQPYRQFLLEVNRSMAMAVAADNAAISRAGAQLKLERLKLRSKDFAEDKGPQVHIENHTETTQINNNSLLSFKNEERKRIIEEMLLGIDLDGANVIDVE